MAKNADLINAKYARKDEFYTQLEDINAEMVHYEKQFKGKIVLMNCDDPTWSNFWRYFHIEFERLGLKKIIATHYEYGEVASYKMEYIGGNDEDFEVGVKTDLTQNGDFRSPECIELLKEADIVVTNPPFSLFREYIALLMKYDKKFIIIGNVNGASYKEVFPLVKNNEIWFGASIHSGDRKFYVPDDYPLNASGCGIDNNGRRFIRVKGVRWFTNIDYSVRHKSLETPYLYAKKDKLYPELYHKFDNYDAINVDKTSEIPMDYDGIMGVPITYLDKHNPDQFEIIGYSEAGNDLCLKFYKDMHLCQPANGGDKPNSKSARYSPMLPFEPTATDNYYTASNADCKMKKVYTRIFIKRKAGK